LPVNINGVDELLQRAIFRLNFKKGSFLYDKNLGSELYKLDKTKSTAELKAEALMLGRKALEEMSEIDISKVEIEKNELDPETVKLIFYILAKNYTERVRIDL